MDLMPSTPTGSPALLTSKRPTFAQRLGAPFEAVIEPQDQAGIIGLSTQVLSSATAACALALMAGILAPAHHPLLLWLIHQVSYPLWGATVAAGFLSGRRLPRFLAISCLALATVNYGWSRLGIPGNPGDAVKVAHIALSGVLALPALLAQWIRPRSRDAA